MKSYKFIKYIKEIIMGQHNYINIDKNLLIEILFILHVT